MARVKSIPSYIWTFAPFVFGILFGGFFPDRLSSVASATTSFIRFLVTLVPLLIVAALSPAIATLVKRGLAGRFAGSVILWYLVSSTLAGLLGVAVSSVLFGIPFSSGTEGALSEATKMILAFREQIDASLPLLAILGAVVLGVLAVRIAPLYALLTKIGNGFVKIGSKLGYALVPVVLLLGTTIGVRYGARVGMGHYLAMVSYTALLCLAWWLFYVLVIMKTIAKQPIRRLVIEYYFPTAIFAAGTCSSLATCRST